MAAAALPIEAEAQPQQEAAPFDPLTQYGPKNEKLPEQLVNALKAAVKAFQQQEQYLRRREVMRDARNRYYERGYQHIYWNQGAQGYSTMTPGGVVTGAGGQNIQAPNYIDDYNIFQPNCRILQAILTQTDTGIDFQADDPNREEDQEAAETAESYRHYFDRSNDVKSIRTQTVRMFLLSSRCIRWTRTEANAELWGLNDQGQPRQMEITTVHGTLESKVPILAKAQKDALYCILADDPDIRQAKAEYKDFAPQIKAGTSGIGENAYERYARLGVLQGARSDTAVGQAFEHVVTRENCWLRPAAFTGPEYDSPLEEVSETDIKPDDTAMTLGDKLKQLYPEGCHVTFVGDVYVGSVNESMDDALVIGFPYEGDGMYRLAWMDPMVVIQDAFNDAMNVTREIWDVGWPSTWIGCEESEYDALAKQKASPFALRLLKNKMAGEPAQNSFYREDNPELPATFVQSVETMQGPLPQFILATPPAIFGAEMQDQKTASGYAQARAQAMGQLGPASAALREMDARMYYQAALWASKNPDHSETIVVPMGDGQNSTMELQKLTKGKFRAHPDDDSSFPESTEAKRTTWDQVIATVGDSPIGMQLMQEPENVLQYFRGKGLSEIVLPQAEAAKQQQFEIEELLLGAPLQPTEEEITEAQIQHTAASISARATGMPEPPPFNAAALPLKPSVGINEWDFHEWHARKTQDWLNSSACRKQLADKNELGVQNVVLHWKAHVEALAALQPPPMVAAPPEGGAGPEKPKKPPNAEGAPNAIANPPGSPGAATM